MTRSTDRILTSHVGSLPRPEGLLGLGRDRLSGQVVDEERLAGELAQATDDVVRREREVGIDLPNDGEYGHAMGSEVDYGAWASYVHPRLGGVTSFALDEVPASNPPRSTIELKVELTRRRDWEAFAEAYGAGGSGLGFNSTNALARRRWVCTGPLSYTGHAEIKRDTENLKRALGNAGYEQGFMCSLGPGSLARTPNVHYATDEEWVWACAEAMREEYLAITGAGLVVQIDEPGFAENWDQFNPAPSLADYRAFTMVRVEALNHALRGIPSELTRFHCCWGSWHGPHTTDLPLADIVDLLLHIDVGAYSLEAANVRHEHEWQVWRDVSLPEDRVLIPGVVSHATNVVEHPELVAERIERFAGVVGRERVIASTDCGLGGRIHPQIAWAKLRSLSEGAQLASERLWK